MISCFLRFQLGEMGPQSQRNGAHCSAPDRPRIYREKILFCKKIYAH